MNIFKKVIVCYIDRTIDEFKDVNINYSDDFITIKNINIYKSSIKKIIID